MPLAKSPDWGKMNLLILSFDENIYLNLTSKYLNPIIRSVYIPKNNAMDIYVGRANSPTRVMIGFEVLIDNLKEFKEDLVCIHSVSTPASKIIVFSDYSYTRVLGVLSLPNFLEPST